jgi:hypothetical protein
VLASEDRFEVFVVYCRERLLEDRHLWALTLFDEVVALGFDRSYPTFTRQLRARQLRPPCEQCRAAKGRAVTIIEHPAGEETLCGFPHSNSYVAAANMRHEARRVSAVAG